MISTRELDALIVFCATEVNAIRKGNVPLQPWAQNKITKLDKITTTLQMYRGEIATRGMDGKSLEVKDLENRLRSAEAVVRQVAQDTYGKDMTPKEFAKAAGYDS